MAPMTASSYFPSLDKLLSGEELLVTWKSVFSAVTSNLELGSDHSAVIERFLRDQEVLELIVNPFNAYPEPSAQTKNAFETRTSAINVTPSSPARYDVKQIKEDALWLSKATKIDEVAALRVVVEECQSRAAAQLLGPFSEEELASIRDAAGDTKYSSSIPIALVSRGAEALDIQRDFDTLESRQKRILRTYLSERRYHLKTVEQMTSKFFSSQDPGGDVGKDTVGPAWLVGCAALMGSKLSLSSPDILLLKCISGIELNMKNVMTGSGWFDDVEIDWTRSQIIEATHSMELMWQFIVYLTRIPSSQVVLRWFGLQRDFKFFCSFSAEEPYIQELFVVLQSISVVVSMAIIDTTGIVTMLDQNCELEVSVNVSQDKAYVLNTKTMYDLTMILLRAADERLPTAGPAVLSWSILLQFLTDRMMARELDESANFDPESSCEADLTLAPDPFKDVLEQINAIIEEDILEYLAHSAVDSSLVFDVLASLSKQLGNTSDALFSARTGGQMRITILNTIKDCVRIGYNPDVLAALLSTVTGGQSYWDALDSEALPFNDDPLATFLDDETLKSSFLTIAESRYPYESLPFLQLLHMVASQWDYPERGNPWNFAAESLRKLGTFTYTLPPDFVDYETAMEEENTNTIQLTRAIQLFIPRSKTLRSHQTRSLSLIPVKDDFYIPAGTIGRMVSDPGPGPRVVFWFHNYSGLAYVGKLLETFLAASDMVDATTGMPADPEAVAEIIGMFATIISSAAPASLEHDAESPIESILAEASSALDHGRDITGVIFDIFREQLQNKSARSGLDVSLEVLVSCVHFIHAQIRIAPGRVWPLMTHSGLLDTVRGGGRLSSIVEGVELVSGRYDLLLSCCSLFDALVEDFATNAIRRRSSSQPARSRPSNSRVQSSRAQLPDISTGVPDNTLSAILLSFTRYLLEVLQSSPTWRYNSEDDRRRITKIIGNAFDKLLKYAFGFDTSLEPEKEDKLKSERALIPLSMSLKAPEKKQTRTKVMEALMPAAMYIVDSFLSTDSGTLTFQPLLRAYFDGLETADLTVCLNMVDLWTGQVSSVLSLSQTLLRLSHMLDRPSSRLEHQIFGASPLIARLYAASDIYRNKVVALFETLVVTASRNTSEPPSLLGHLGPQTAKNFLHSLADLDKPLSREDNLKTIWHFLSTVMSSRQQWFANYLLTGKTPRDAMKTRIGEKELVTLDRTLLATALEALSKIDEIPIAESLAMLEFVHEAQNFRLLAVGSSPRYGAFIQSISNFVGNLKPLGQSRALEAAIADSYQTRIAAYIGEILAMHLFHSRQMGASLQSKDILKNLTYFSRFALAVPDYNVSLHTLLKQNFEKGYPGCTVQDLKRTTLERRQLGADYFYDIQLTDRMLSLDKGWTGLKADGLRADFARANVNLSLVDAQIALFHGWESLLTELKENISAEPELQKILSTAVTNCLIANGRSQPPEEIFSRLSLTRATLALALSTDLVNARPSSPDVKSLLPTVWSTICNLRGSFENPVPDDDVLYFRTLLQLLFLAIHVHSDIGAPAQREEIGASVRMAQSASIMPIILDVLKRVVSMGFRELASTIHESPADSIPADLLLLTEILQSCLQIPGIELCHSQIVSMMISHSVPLLALKLFSWSEVIAIDGDPIYGELSILFLVALSSMPSMAEQLAIGGVLSQIFSADIMSYFRRPGVNPFSESAGLQRCYRIWTTGILPLLIKLLHAVESSIAVEVAQFLNQFPLMLTQSEEAFDAPETNRIMPKGQTKYITVSVCSEVCSMAFIIYVLSVIREQSTTDIPEVKWDGAGVLENVEFWLSSKALLRERILPMGAKETAMVKKKVDQGKIVSQLELKVISELNLIRDVLTSGDNP